MSKRKEIKIRICNAGRMVREGDNTCPHNLSVNVLPCSCHRPFIDYRVRNYLLGKDKT